MSDSKSPRSPPDPKPLDSAAPGRPADAAPSGRSERGILPRPPGRAGGSRHSAITHSLYNYASYKLWADKVSRSWEPGKGPKG